MKKVLSLILILTFLVSIIQLPASAKSYAPGFFNDTTLKSGATLGSNGKRTHNYWVAPYGEELTHFDYSASSGGVPATSYYVENTQNDGRLTVDSEGIISINSDYAKGGHLMQVFATLDSYTCKSGNFNLVADSPFIYDFDNEAHALADGILYARDDAASTAIFENAALTTDAKGNKYVVSATDADYIGFRAHQPNSPINSTVLEFDVKLSEDKPFSIVFNNDGTTVFKWDNETQKLINNPSNKYPYTDFKTPDVVEPGWHKIKLLLELKKASDTNNPYRATYPRGVIFFDGELVSSSFKLPTLDGYSTSNANTLKRVMRFEGSDGIDNFKYYGSSTPHAYDVELTGEVKSGATLSATAKSFSFFSSTEGDSAPTSYEYSYYVSNTEDPEGEYTKVPAVAESDEVYINNKGNLVINSDLTGRYIKVGARASYRGGKSPEAMSAPYKVEGYADGFTVPYVIYDAERDGVLVRSYDKYYDEPRGLVEIAGKKATPWGPKDANVINPSKIKESARESTMATWEKYGDLGSSPNNIKVNAQMGLDKYQYIVVEMYSAVDNNQPFIWRFYKNNPDTTGSDHFRATFNANWEGEWRKVRLAIAGGLDDRGDFSYSYNPLGSPYQAESFTLSANVTSQFEPDTEVYISKIYLEGAREEKTTANEKGEIILPDRYNAGKMTDYVSILKEKHPNKAHPRLLVNDEVLNRIKTTKDTDSFMKAAYDTVKAKADAYLLEATSDASYIKNNATAFSRKVENVAKACGIMYLLTGETKYADRIWQEAEVMIKMEGADGLCWYNTSTGLDAGHIANGMGLLYDWCYDYLTDEQKLAIRNAVMVNTFASSTKIRDGGGFMGFRNNVVAANAKGSLTAFLAFCDEEGYEDLANEYINNVIDYLPVNLGQQFKPDGAYSEGAGYWNYTVTAIMTMSDMLTKCLDTDGGLSDMEGLSKTGYFHMALRGGNYLYNLFNYSDSNKNLSQNLSPVFLYLGKRYNIPALSAYRLDTVEVDNNKYTLEDLLWYDPAYISDVNWKEELPKDFFLDGLEPVVSMRSSYDRTIYNESAGKYLGLDYYIAAKGGNSKTGHDQYDAGTFVLDANGKRWIHDLGADVYGGLSPDHYYYRTRTEGHNCIVFDPARGWEEGSGQTVAQNQYDTKCPIVDSGSSEGEAYSIIDLQPSYQETVEEYKRGFSLLNNRTQFIVQDEFKTKEPFELYSYFHVEKSTIVVNSDGRSLTLQSYNPRAYMRVDFITDIEDFEIGYMDAVHHEASPKGDPSSDNVYVTGYSTADYKKFYFHADNVQDATITVVFTPIKEGNTVSLPPIKPLSDWDEYLDGGSLTEVCNVYINSINGNVVNITANQKPNGNANQSVIIAAYKNNALVAVGTLRKTVATNTNDYVIEGFNPTDYDTIKAFVWDNTTSTLKPYAHAKEIKN